LGTAHAILCAKEALEGNVVVAFADTYLKQILHLIHQKKALSGYNRLKIPVPFGVVKLNDANQITEFVEKPETFISNLAIIGILLRKRWKLSEK
jgi:glucose-1-phosphate thymidylyltransferase